MRSKVKPSKRAAEQVPDGVRLPPKNRPIVSWEFDPSQIKEYHTDELTFGRIKAFLYENIYKSITQHDLKQCFHLLKVAARETTLDPYVLFRFIMILIESNITIRVGKNVLVHSERLINHLNLSKPDIFCEYLSYYIRHKRYEDAKEHYYLRHKQMYSAIHRRLPHIYSYLRSYELLFNYITWSQKDNSLDIAPLFDRSTQGWLINAMNYLTQAHGNYEYFVMCVVNVLIKYGYNKKAYILASEFKRNNPSNYSAQLILLYVIRLRCHHTTSAFNPRDIDSDQKHVPEAPEDIVLKEKNRTEQLSNINSFSLTTDDEHLDDNSLPILEDRSTSMVNLRYLDPSCSEVLEFANDQQNLVSIMNCLMDNLENVRHMCDISKWRHLHKTIKRIFASGKQILILDAQRCWQDNYRRYWGSLRIEEVFGKDLTDKEKKVLRKVSKIIREKLDRKGL